jgi:hypothetical protein
MPDGMVAVNHLDDAVQWRKRNHTIPSMNGFSFEEATRGQFVEAERFHDYSPVDGAILHSPTMVVNFSRK